MGSSRSSRGIDRQPARSDACWQRRCEPLLLYLATPRRWDELTAWASIRGISGCRLRNMLAWLEDEHVAGASVERRGPHATRVADPVWHRSGEPRTKWPGEAA